MPKKSAPKKRVKKKSKGKSAFFLLALVFGIIVFAVYYFKIYKPKVFTIEREIYLNNLPPNFASAGLDVSHHQGNIDFERLFEKERYDTLISWVYVKITEGTDFLDDQYSENRAKLDDLQIANGAYHFFNPKKPPRKQVDFFLANWKIDAKQLPPVLDVETEGFSDQDLIDKMHIWLSQVELRTGIRPIIYTSLSFYNTKFKDKFPSHKFWIAAYSQEPNFNDPQIIHWQYSDKGKLPGIDTDVDLNVSNIKYP